MPKKTIFEGKWGIVHFDASNADIKDDTFQTFLIIMKRIKLLNMSMKKSKNYETFSKSYLFCKR